MLYEAIVLQHTSKTNDYGETIKLSEGYEYFTNDIKEFIHAKEGNFQRYLCYSPYSPYGWQRCENYIFEPNFPVPALVYKDYWRIGRGGEVIYRVLHDYIRVCWTFFPMSDPDEAYMIIQRRGESEVETIWLIDEEG